MHELGIVFHMIETLEEVGRQNGLSTIRRVSLELGEVTAIIPDYLLDCWRWAVDRTELLKGAQLDIHQIDAVTICNDCGKTYPTVEYGKICPHCQSPNTALLRGNEIEIATVEGC